jgi:hypothetical protein
MSTMNTSTIETREIGIITPELVERLRADIRDAVTSLSIPEVRFLVDAYYQQQDNRKGSASQIRSIEKDAKKKGTEPEPHRMLDWLFKQNDVLEVEIKKALDTWSDTYVVGRWAKSIVGIGPVISAGLLANIEIEKAQTVGAIWRFAGLDPTVKWEKGKKRPWNASLKRLAWIIGDCFCKFSNHPNETYGSVYKARKALEIERNEAGMFAEQAKYTLATKKIKDEETRAIYESGKLPDGRLHLRATRYAAKLFLSHWHHVAFETRFGEPPPKPYILTQPEHTHFMGPPNWPMSE